MPNFLLDLHVDRVDLVDEGANSAAFIKLYKGKETNKNMNYEEILKSMKPEDAAVIVAQVEKAKGEIPAATTTELNKAKADLQKSEDDKKKLEDKVAEMSKPTPSTEDVLKGLDPTVKAMFEQLKSKADAAETAIKKMNDQKIEDEAIAKAKDLKNIPVEESKLVEIVKGASTELMDVLKAANAAINTKLTETGSGRGDTTADAKSAWGKIEKKAQGIAAEMKITQAAAISEVIKRHPELYQEYLDGGAN